MRYRVMENDFITFDIDTVIDHCIDPDYYEDDDEFEEWVNGRYNTVYMYGNEYTPYEILDNCGGLDEALGDYKEMRNDEAREEARYDLRNADPGEKVYIQNYTVLVEEEDAGDCDGDEDLILEIDSESAKTAIDELRSMIEEARAKDLEKDTADKEKAEKYLDLFQTLGD